MTRYQVALDVLTITEEMKEFMKAKSIKTATAFNMKTAFVGAKDVLVEFIIRFFSKNDKDVARSLVRSIVEA